MWIQYDTATGDVTGSNSHKAEALPEGRAQMEVSWFVQVDRVKVNLDTLELEEIEVE